MVGEVTMNDAAYKLIRPFLFFALTILVSCIPTGKSAHQSPVPSSTRLVESSTSPLPQTSTPAAVRTISESVQPSQTLTPTTLPAMPQTIMSTSTFTVFLPPTNTKPPRPT